MQSASIWDPGHLYRTIFPYLKANPDVIATYPDNLQAIIQTTLRDKPMVKKFAAFAHHPVDGNNSECRRPFTPVSLPINFIIDSREQTPQPSSRPRTPLDSSSARKKGECPKCRGLASDQQCVREIVVEEREDSQSLNGTVLTSATEDDRLPPKVSEFLIYWPWC